MIIFLFVSCGAKKNKKTTPLEENLLLASHNEIRCESIEKQKQSPSITAILKTSKQLPNISEKYLRLKGKSLNFSDKAFIPTGGHSWNSPLILSDREFNELWRDLQARANKIQSPLWEALIKGEEIRDELLLDTKTDEAIMLLPELNYLASLALRFKSYSCAKEALETRRKDDVRQYLSLSNKSCLLSDKTDCLEAELEKYSSLTKERQSELEKDLLSICERNEKREICASEWYVMKQKGEALKFYQSRSRILEKETYSKLFKLNDRFRRFNCEKRENTLVMSVPFFSSNGAFSSYNEAYTELLSKAERYWSNSKFKIEFYDAKKAKGSVQVIRTTDFISRVNEATPLFIELSKSTKGIMASKTFAHEFGHVLGFPDCYLEFFEREKNQIIYYELDHKRKNLMCSLRFGEKIPDEYLEELANRSCL